ncbi:MAG: hypothetical protein L0241_04845 [Planctomycetia bacterium]|nr:hypothetical protein [Planctomycetia bacterium]
MEKLHRTRRSKGTKSHSRLTPPTLPVDPPPGDVPEDEQFIMDGQLPPQLVATGNRRGKNDALAFGEGVEDIFVHTDTIVVPEAGGVRLIPTSGPELFIRTDAPVTEGAKVNALDSLDEIFASSCIGRREYGGGGPRTALALTEQSLSPGWPGGVRLLLSGDPCSSLTTICEQRGVSLFSAERHRCPRNLVFHMGHDRVVIRQKIDRRNDPLSTDEANRLTEILDGAGVVAVVSPKDASIARAAVSAPNVGVRYVQPTGALSWPDTAALLAEADCVVCNFSELCWLGQAAGLTTPPHFTEASPGAPWVAATILQGLYHQGLCGKEAAACTMGSHGSVVADWRRGSIWQTVLEFLDDGRGVPTVVGCGDLWLASWIACRAWAAFGHLRHPEAAAAMRVTVTVARRLGLRSDQYDVRSILLIG